MFTNKAELFVQASAFNQWLMFTLLIITQPKKNIFFFLFVTITFIAGMALEIVGSKTGLLFGEYIYGNVLGAKMFDVPIILGVNWVIVVYCSGMVMEKLHAWVDRKYALAGVTLSPKVKKLSIIFDGALLATFFDFVMEPVAIKLGYWQWLGNGTVPFMNYAGWFVFSAFLLFVFKLLRFEKHNHFAVHLFIIELLFFSTLRTFL